MNSERVFLLLVAFTCLVDAQSRPADWTLKKQRVVNGPEAELLVRAGDINNLGFGWPDHFDPFTGDSTPAHGFPWDVPAGAPGGTDRIMVGSAVTADDPPREGYSGVPRDKTRPEPIVIEMGELPAKVESVVIQMFLDDFQAPVFGSRFQVSLNGVRIPSFEKAVNSLEQTGPVGKLVTLRLLPEYWPLLRANGGVMKLLINDPVTHVADGYAVDFVRVLVNPKPFRHGVSVLTKVFDEESGKPLAGAAVNAANRTASTGSAGTAQLTGVPAGLVVVSAVAAGYEEGSGAADLKAGETGEVEIRLKRHKESAGDLSSAIRERGTANVYGIRFDVNSAKLRPDSEPALASVLKLIEGQPDSKWTIAGHTDNQGGAELNQKLSESRAASVIAWLVSKGVAQPRLAAAGYGASRPVADNATENGRALNRRVEVAVGR